MFKKNDFGSLVSFRIAIIILFTLKPEILPQSKDKTTNWSEPKFEHIKTSRVFVANYGYPLSQEML